MIVIAITQNGEAQRITTPYPLYQGTTTDRILVLSPYPSTIPLSICFTNPKGVSTEWHPMLQAKLPDEYSAMAVSAWTYAPSGAWTQYYGTGYISILASQPSATYVEDNEGEIVVDPETGIAEVEDQRYEYTNSYMVPITIEEAPAPTFSTPADNNVYEEITDAIAQQGAKITAIEEAIGGEEGLEGTGGINGDIADLKAEDIVLDGKITVQKERIDDVEEDISEINGEIEELQSSLVTGVKGAAESEYRHGNVNLTKANIGLGNVDNTADINKPVSTSQQNAINTAKEQAISSAVEQANAYTNEQIGDRVGASVYVSDEDDVSEYHAVANIAFKTKNGFPSATERPVIDLTSLKKFYNSISDVTNISSPTSEEVIGAMEDNSALITTETSYGNWKNVIPEGCEGHNGVLQIEKVRSGDASGEYTENKLFYGEGTIPNYETMVTESVKLIEDQGFIYALKSTQTGGSIVRYDKETNETETIQTFNLMPFARLVNFIKIGTAFYIICYSSTSNTVYIRIYDPTNSVNTYVLSPLKTYVIQTPPNAFPMLVFPEDPTKIYCFGGQGSFAVFDTTTNTWGSLIPLADDASNAIDGNIMCACGAYKQSDSSVSFYAYFANNTQYIDGVFSVSLTGQCVFYDNLVNDELIDVEATCCYPEILSYDENGKLGWTLWATSTGIFGIEVENLYFASSPFSEQKAVFSFIPSVDIEHIAIQDLDEIDGFFYVNGHRLNSGELGNRLWVDKIDWFGEETTGYRLYKAIRFSYGLLLSGEKLYCAIGDGYYWYYNTEPAPKLYYGILTPAGFIWTEAGKNSGGSGGGGGEDPVDVSGLMPRPLYQGQDVTAFYFNTYATVQQVDSFLALLQPDSLDVPERTLISTSGDSFYSVVAVDLSDFDEDGTGYAMAIVYVPNGDPEEAEVLDIVYVSEYSAYNAAILASLLDGFTYSTAGWQGNGYYTLPTGASYTIEDIMSTNYSYHEFLQSFISANEKTPIWSMIYVLGASSTSV